MFASRSTKKRTVPGLLILAAALLVLLLSFSLALAADVVLDSIVATVNGKIITRYELDEQLRPVYEQMRGRTLTTDEMRQVEALRRQALDRMIDDMLIVDDAARYNLKITDAEVEAQTKVFREKRELSEADFKKQLELQHMPLEEFNRNMRRDLIKHRLIGGVVTAKVVVTDTEVEHEYNERKAEFAKDSMVQLALILVPAGMSASELKATIESGKMTFAQAAEKYSQGPSPKQGGDIGFIAWKDLAPEWNTVLRGLTPGQIAQPVHVNDFEGLLQVVSIQEGEQLPLDAVREQIYNSLHEGKFDKVFKDYMEKLRGKAVIEYRNM
ncbi:MAG: peptidylprolyl isomerase [Deltaproteobacteria bacterium HGW-Deltaproteobacteria-8]|jgi:peptidyl-prolyl cis-trans isomerase SurA|nr:MAG: peptidylprolyl isomerase [Deltaproteobacteria bacterium HGW-Deltaproteobacteria-8]